MAVIINPVLKKKHIGKLDAEEKKKLFNDTRALAMYKVSGTVLNGTDSILISSIFSTVKAGILGNYNLLTNQVYSFVMTLFTATSASVGNLAATSDKNHQYGIFNRMMFISFWLYCFCTTSLWTLLNPFMHVWQSSEYVFEWYIVLPIVIEFYIRGMLSPVTQFRTSNGLFVQGKYRPVIMAVLNIGISILMAHRVGIAGIFWGTVISRALTQLWYDPWLIYKKVFGKKIFGYIKIYAVYGIVTVGCCALTSGLLNLIMSNEGVLKVLLGGVLCLIIPNAVIVLLFFRSKNFKETVGMAMSLVKGKIKR